MFIVFFIVNIALNKPTYQQYPFRQGDATYDSSNAVDGLKVDLKRSGGQCVYSSLEETATLWVNMTSIHSIHNITIYYMTENYPWGIIYFWNFLLISFLAYHNIFYRVFFSFLQIYISNKNKH